MLFEVYESKHDVDSKIFPTRIEVSTMGQSINQDKVASYVPYAKTLTFEDQRTTRQRKKLPSTVYHLAFHLTYQLRYTGWLSHTESFRYPYDKLINAFQGSSQASCMCQTRTCMC